MNNLTNPEYQTLEVELFDIEKQFGDSRLTPEQVEQMTARQQEIVARQQEIANSADNDKK